MAEKKVNKPKATPKKKEKPKKPAALSPKCIANQRGKMSDIYTEDGTRLTIKQAKFIDSYITSGNLAQAAIDAGYKWHDDRNYASAVGQEIVAKPFIKKEIDARMRKSEKKSIADRQEIMEFWSSMMRGEILDQFDMPTTNADKLKAAAELAKRSVDIEDRIRERNSTQNVAPEIKIKLDWGGKNDGE